MTDSPDCYLLLCAVIFSHPRLPGILAPGFFSFFSPLSRRPRLFAPAFRYFCLPDFELYAGTTSLLTGLHHPDPSIAPARAFSAPHLGILQEV